MERNIRTKYQAHWCPACKVDQMLAPEKREQLASISVTDCKQLPGGMWEETRPRYGCAKHPVVSMVYLLDGTSLPYVEYAELVRNSQTES